MGSIAKKSLRGIIWSAIERFSLQGVQFAIGIVLARLLSPSDFGMIGMLSIFLSVSQIFVDAGFSNAIIRAKNVSKEDYGTVFLVNCVISILCFALLWVISPFIASFYNMPELSPVVKVIAVTLILNALYAVHKSKLSRNVDFKTQSKCSFISAVLSGFLGIYLAYIGYGVWSLVWQAIANSLINFLLYVYFLKWIPFPCFSWSSFKDLFGFGSKLLVSGLIHSVYSNMYNLVIGKTFSSRDLGFFTRGAQLALFPSQNISGILSRVTFPILSQIQDDREKLNSTYQKYLTISCFVIFPMMMILCSLAEPIVSILLGEKWMPCVVLIQILCFGFMLDPINSINLNLLNVMGRSDLVLKLEIIKKSIAITILFVSLPFGLIGICVGRTINNFIAMLVNANYTGSFIELSRARQLLLLVPYYLSSLICACVAYCVTTLLVKEDLLKLLIGVLSYMLLYLGIAKIFKFTAFVELCRLYKNRKKDVI